MVYKIIDAKPGDEMVVMAGCNIAGRKRVTVQLEEEMPTQEE